MEWGMGMDYQFKLYFCRANTDMKFGRTHGMRTLLVLTGVTTREEVSKLSDDCKPEFFTNSIGDVLSCHNI